MLKIYFLTVFCFLPIYTLQLPTNEETNPSFQAIFPKSKPILSSTGACTKDDLKVHCLSLEKCVPLISTQAIFQKIKNCYNTIVFKYFNINATNNPDVVYDYYSEYSQNVIHFDKIPALCDVKKNFDKCVETATFKNCFNIKNFKNVPFLYNTDVYAKARGMIANYMQNDYACGPAYNVVSDAKTMNCVIQYGSNCDEEDASCSNAADSYMNCVAKQVGDNCGKAAGCAAKKYWSLQLCYFSDCDYCKNLDYNKNPINNLCSEDSSNANKVLLNVPLVLITF